MSAPKGARQRVATPRKAAGASKGRKPTPRKQPANSPADPPQTPPDHSLGRNRAAAEATIGALKEAGHLQPVDSARIATLQALADAVDADPDNASLWREYRATEASLREVHDETDPDLPDLVAGLSTPVVKPANARKANARPSARSRRS